MYWKCIDLLLLLPRHRTRRTRSTGTRTKIIRTWTSRTRKEQVQEQEQESSEHEHQKQEKNKYKNKNKNHQNMNINNKKRTSTRTRTRIIRTWTSRTRKEQEPREQVTSDKWAAKINDHVNYFYRRQAGRRLDSAPSANVVAMATKIGPWSSPLVDPMPNMRPNWHWLICDLKKKIAKISLPWQQGSAPQNFAWFHCIGHPRKPPVGPNIFCISAIQADL